MTDVRAFELEALNRLDDIEHLCAKLKGRLYLTSFETLIRDLDCTYMYFCQRYEFRRRFPAHAINPYELDWKPKTSESEFVENTIPDDIRIGWIALKANCTYERAAQSLTRITHIYQLRAQLGLDDEPEVAEDMPFYAIKQSSASR